MELRLKTLAALDPLAVPLPHGTEVTTRVDRVAGAHRVPQGAVGRVSRVQGEWVDVTVVGVGVVRYARDELTPRRAGQMRYAQRRQAAWTSLVGCIVLETTVGSRAWGLADESSDTDRRGVFVLPLSWTSGLVAPPDCLVSADGSASYWELGKAVRQALNADPNTLEMLFVPGARAADPIGEWILASRDAFVSSEIYGSFGRYALSQLKRLEQGMRLAHHRTTVLGWLRDEPGLTLDATAARLAALSPKAAPTGRDAVEQAREYLKQLYRSLYDQGLMDSNEFAGLARFASDKSHELELPRELRPKNAYNLLRLIATAAHWLATGTPQFEMTGALRARLLAVKQGQVPLEDILQEAEALATQLEAARQSTPLPRRPDLVRADALLRNIAQEVARRWVQQADGPFGKDAPPPPEPGWEE